MFNDVFSVSQVVCQYRGLVSRFEVWVYQEFIVKRSLCTLGYYRKIASWTGVRIAENKIWTFQVRSRNVIQSAINFGEIKIKLTSLTHLFFRTIYTITALHICSFYSVYSYMLRVNITSSGKILTPKRRECVSNFTENKVSRNM